VKDGAAAGASGAADNKAAMFKVVSMWRGVLIRAACVPRKSFASPRLRQPMECRGCGGFRAPFAAD